MASSSVMRSAVVVLAVISSVAVMANAQAPAPAPTSAGFSIVPSVVGPAVAMVLAFFGSRMLC
jgi:hypothetical protein